MRTLSGQYPVNNKLTDFSFEVAENWEELTPEQYAHILQILTYQKADPYTLKASFISLLCGNKHFPIIATFDEDELTGLLPIIDFIFTTRPPVVNKFPILNINKKECHAPADDLSNIGFAEWCFAYQFYQLYFEFKNAAYLNQLIACLYRPADSEQNENNENYSGDLRFPFNENLIEKRAKSVAAIEEHIKHAVLVWFSSALLQVMDRLPNVFPPVDTAQQQQQEEQEAKQENPTNWMTIFRELLGPKWGTANQLKFENAMFVLDGLEEQHIAFKQAKESAIA